MGVSGVVGCEVWTKTGRYPSRCRTGGRLCSVPVKEWGSAARERQGAYENAPFDRGMVEGRVWVRRNAESVVRAEAGIIACLWRF